MGRQVGVAVGQRLGRSLLELGGNNAVILTELALNFASFFLMLSIDSPRSCSLTVFLLFPAPTLIRCPKLR